MPLELLQYLQEISKLSGVTTSFYTNYFTPALISHNSVYASRL